MRQSHTVDPEHAQRAHRVLQAVWVIASAQHNDAVARDVAEMGTRLRNAIDAADWKRSTEIIAEVRTWLCTMTGVLAARLTRVFEID